MRSRFLALCLPVLLLAATVQPASAVGILPTASSWALNLDGHLFDSLGSPVGFPASGGGLTGVAPTIAGLQAAGYLGLTENGSMVVPAGFPTTPGYFDGSTFVSTTSISFDISGAGMHDILSFFDNDFVAFDPTGAETNPYNNEYASVFNLGPSALSWDVNEPGYTHGDIYSGGTGPDTSFCPDGVHTGCKSLVEQGASSLDDVNNIPDPLNPDDVSIAMGYHFKLTGSQVATLTFTQTLNNPFLPGLYFGQFDDQDLTAGIYYYASIKITGSGAVPEANSALMLLVGLGSIGMFAQFKSRKA